MVQQKRNKSKRTKRVKMVVARKRDQEMTRLGAALRGLGSLGGTAIGSLVGAGGAGGGIGRQLGAGLSKWLGSGDYALSKNSIVQRASDDVPMMHKDGQSIVVRHKEYLGEILGSTAFTVQQTYNVNPGLSSTFPWLAAIASKFQEYKILGMVFHYVPTSGTAVGTASTALGSVLVQTTYRAGDTAPTTKMEMLNEFWSTEITPYESGCHPIECDPKENPYNLHYVRTGALTSGADQLLYDLGTTFVATSGMQTNGVVGDLWISYEIELKKPMLTSPVLDPSAGLSGMATQGITTSSIFGTDMDYGNGTLTDRIALVGNTITINPQLAGWFYVYIDLYATSVFSTSGIPSYAVTGCTKALVVKNTTLVAQNSGVASNPLYIIQLAVFKSDTSVPAVITITPVFTGAVSYTHVAVYQRSTPFWT